MRDIVLADTVFMAFTTRAFATGIPTVLAGTPVVSAYEDAGLTQITAGITLGVDHDSVVGLNMLTIAATGANGYEADKDYNLVITTGTVGGVSVVGEVVGQFSIQRAPVNWANVTDPTTALDLSGTDIQLVATTTTNIDQRGTDSALLAANINLSAGVVESNLLQMGGVVQSGTDLKDFADAGYDPATNKVQGVVLVDTTTTNTDMRGTDSAATEAKQDIIDTNVDDIKAVIEIHSGTAQAGSSTTITLDTGANGTVDDIYTGARCSIIAGTGAQTHRLIKTYDASTRIATMSKAWIITPNNTSEFVLSPAEVDVELWNSLAVTGDGDWAEMQTDLDAVLVDTNELQSDDVPGLIAALNNAPAVSVADILTTQMTEAFAADGVAPTLAQALFLIQQMLGDFGIAGTTLTVRKIDGTTTAAIFTLDDGTNPTDLTRTT